MIHLLLSAVALNRTIHFVCVVSEILIPKHIIYSCIQTPTKKQRLTSDILCQAPRSVASGFLLFRLKIIRKPSTLFYS